MVWRERNCINFTIGQPSRKRVLPLIVHILPSNLKWFNEEGTHWEELLQLLREKVLETDSHGKDGTAAGVQGSSLQFTYRYRETRPKFRVIAFPGEDEEDGGSRGAGRYQSLPVSSSTLLVWVFQFDPANPYAPLPTETFFSTPITSFFPVVDTVKSSAVGRDGHNGEKIPRDEEKQLQLALARSLEDKGPSGGASLSNGS